MRDAVLRAFASSDTTASPFLMLLLLPVWRTPYGDRTRIKTLLHLPKSAMAMILPSKQIDDPYHFAGFQSSKLPI